MAEVRAEQLAELGLGQLALVKRVLIARRLGVHAPVGRRDDEHAVGGKHAVDLLEHRVLLDEMLDDLERHDDVERVVVEPSEVERRSDVNSRFGAA